MGRNHKSAVSSSTPERKLQLIPLSERFSVEIRPEVLPGAGHCEVIIHNRGIQRTSYTIVAYDPVIALNFSEGQGQQKVVGPGKTKKVNLYVSPKKRPFISRPQPYPFTVQVSTPGRSQQSVEGQIVIRPLLPVWAAALFILLLLLAGTAWARYGRDLNHFLAALPLLNHAFPGPATTTPTPLMPTATSLPATATAAVTATPPFVFAQISHIRIDEAGHYIVDFKQTNMSQAQEQSGLLFYFGALSADNAPVPDSSWRLYTGATPFTDFTISRRPVAAYKLCVVANNGPGPIPLENSHCLPLPEPDP